MNMLLRKYRVTFSFIALILDWGLVALIGPQKEHSELISFLLLFLGFMGIALFFLTLVLAEEHFHACVKKNAENEFKQKP